MPAIETLVLTDAESTPVNRSFAPSKIEGDTAHFVDRSGGIIQGYPKVSIRVTEPKAGDSYGRVVLKMVVPQMEVSAGSTGSGLQAAPTKAFDNYLELTGRFHVRSTEQQRKNMRTMLLDALATALPVACFDKIEPVY